MAASASQHLTLLLDRAEEQARLLKDALRIRDLRIAELEQKVRHLQETKTENVVCQVLFFVFRLVFLKMIRLFGKFKIGRV